jgi:hypothetical protein
MKTRQGFVSNSSTSSFICVVCGEKYTGYDASPSEFDCAECMNYHIMCNEHLEDMPELSEAEELELAEGEGSIHTSQCPVCRLEIYAEDEMAKYLEKTRGVSREDVFAKVKAMNKRRRKLYNAEYISHVCEKFELNDDILMKEVKEKFGTWDKYSAFIWK